jgi:hypothetical protein
MLLTHLLVLLASPASGSQFPPNATMVIDGYTGESGFGVSVAISSTEMVIGADGAEKAFVFARNEDGGFPATATMVPRRRQDKKIKLKKESSRRREDQILRHQSRLSTLTWTKLQMILESRQMMEPCLVLTPKASTTLLQVRSLDIRERVTTRKEGQETFTTHLVK